MTLTNRIKKCIETKIDQGYRDFIIFPFGEIGMQVKRILNEAYGIKEKYIFDNHLCRYNQQIRGGINMNSIDTKGCCLILAVEDWKTYEELKISAEKYFDKKDISDILDPSVIESCEKVLFTTKIGKYSYGPICRNHPVIESIGAFCSFATGVDAVGNHEMEYVTTHPMIFWGQNYSNVERKYIGFDKESWFFPGIKPKGCVTKLKRSKIGNDVWLGKNVIITNGIDIGNGVIAGAGSVLTKDIPDYAVVVGVPAKIIRYRYSEEEIKYLNKIAWWDWTDDEIRERYDDFYLPIQKFIAKYNVKNGTT